MRVSSTKFSVLALLLAIIVTARSAEAQQSTTGPAPPAGIDRGLRADKSQSQVIIPGVPSYIWHHGCGPTSVGMVIGYWDAHGRPGLIEGNAGSQTVAVNAMIANDNQDGVCGGLASDHFQDYSCPKDYYPDLIPDRSQTGGAHANDCVADFMYTSRSMDGNYYGWSWFSDVSSAFVNYVNMVDPDAQPQASRYYFGSFSFESYKAQIDACHPVVLLVDTDGNGSTDHFVTGIGYDDETEEYAVYDTWNHITHWYAWRGMASGNTWGVFGAVTFSVEVPPQVVSVSPLPHQTGVPATAPVTAVFSDDLDPATINDTTFVVRSADGRRYSGLVTYDGPSRAATFTPLEDYRIGDEITVSLTQAVTGANDQSMAAGFVWRFLVTTEAALGRFRAAVDIPQPCNAFDVKSAEVDGNSYPDLLVAHYNCSEQVTVLLGDSAGNPIVDSTYAVTARPYSIATGDFDGDNRIDLVVAGRASDELSILINLGDGTFEHDSSYSVTDEIGKVITADLNADGHLDLAVPFGTPDQAGVTVYAGNGDGTFIGPTDYPINTFPMKATTADVDGDGDLDLMVLNAIPPSFWVVSVLHNLGDGTFADRVDYPTADSPQSLVAVDFDGDLDVDLALTLLSGGLQFLQNNGSGGLNALDEETVAPFIGDIAMADVDGDNDQDLVTAHRSLNGRVSILINDGSGSFALTDTLAVGSYPETIIATDIDRDGRLDLVTANAGSSDVSVLFNQGCCGLFTGGYTGNTNCSEDGKLTLSDVTTLIDHVYISKIPLCCAHDGNTNGSPDGKISLSDVTRLIDNIYISKQPTELCL